MIKNSELIVSQISECVPVFSVILSFIKLQYLKIHIIFLFFECVTNIATRDILLVTPGSCDADA